MRPGPPSPETLNPKALRFGLSLTPGARCSRWTGPRPTASRPLQAFSCTSMAGCEPSTKPDVLEPNPRGVWTAGPSRFFMIARALNRPGSSCDWVSGQTNSLWRSLTNIRTDAVMSAVWYSKDSRRGKDMHQENGSRDFVFAAIGLAMLKSTLTLAALLLVAVFANAQTSRGTVTGTILDPTGAVITGARVTLTGVETGVRLSTNSNDAGVYRFDAVDPGSYDLTVSLPGFSTYLSTHIGVEANRATTIDPALKVGAAETRIEVSGEASEILIKDSPLRGGNFQTSEVRNLPLLGLNPLSLARALPGATEAAGSYVWGNAGSGPNGNGGGFSINGQRPRGNNYLLDGTENNDVFLNGEEQVFRIADAVEEVSVQTGNFGVEFGRAGGGVFNVVTKSGTNSLHGTLLWRYQSQRFDSVSNLDKLNGISQSVFSHNVFGFTAGGPVRKNKTFFFAGFQQDTNHSTANLPVLI